MTLQPYRWPSTLSFRDLALIGIVAFLVLDRGVPLARAWTGQEQAPRVALGSAFTYQGRILDAGLPPDGAVDFEFALFDAAEDGAQVGPTFSASSVPVANGLFTVQLDFGAATFAGEARWIEVRAKDPQAGQYQVMGRQELTATPYALYASAVPWSGITGVPEDVGNAWSLTGNAGTTAENFLGTTDAAPLEIHVNGERALRLEPTSGSPNVIGGERFNSALDGAVGATVGGGGQNGLGSDNNRNTVMADYGTVSGGRGNRAGDNDSTNSATDATVGGGIDNTAGGQHSTIGGGSNNSALFPNGTIGGGRQNVAGGASTVAGGQSNAASGGFSFIGGGSSNLATALLATVGGGQSNWASGTLSSVGGGSYNSATSSGATVSGGARNLATGAYSFVGGGSDNWAAGSYSVAMGLRARLVGDGSFMFADSNDFDFNSNLDNAFRVRVTNGARFVVGINPSGDPTWSCSVTNGNSWSCSSDRNLKTNFADVDGRGILDSLVGVPIQYWTGKGADPEVRHIGPMAQDFAAAFAVGADDVSISTIDLDGVALASIQALYELVQEQESRLIAMEGSSAPLARGSDSPPSWLSWVALCLGAVALLASTVSAVSARRLSSADSRR